MNTMKKIDIKFQNGKIYKEYVTMDGLNSILSIPEYIGMLKISFSIESLIGNFTFLYNFKMLKKHGIC